MSFRYLAFAAALALLSCNNSSNLAKVKEDTRERDLVRRDTVVVIDSITQADTLFAMLPAETVIQVRVPGESLPVIRLRKTIVSETQSVHVILSDLDEGQLRVGISHSRPDANIRISQIILPDGGTDGPFGQELTYDIRQKGNYTIVINRSNMASGNQSGDVFITLER